jgi:hypothetical protein
MPDREVFQELAFPTAGIDLRGAYRDQAEGTTRSGVNVRGFEPTTQRMRGGSRPGLSKYPVAQLPNGAHLIQHLNSVVVADGTALLSNFVFPAPTIADPSSPGLPASWPPGQTSRIPTGQIIPVGGTGAQPNKKFPFQTVVVPSGIKYVQDVAADGPLNLTLGSPVTAGNLLVVCAIKGDIGGGIHITDNQGNTWNLAASVSDPFDDQLNLYYAIASSSGTLTVSAHGSNPGVQAISEWSGVSQLTPFDAANTADFDSSVTGNVTVSNGAVSVAGHGELVIAHFVVTNLANDPTNFTPVAGFTTLKTSASTESSGCYVIGPSPGSVVAAMTANVLFSALDGDGTQILVVGASFKPA